MTFAPTEEQTQALVLYQTGGPLVIEAGAGAGKTSTLRLLAEATPSKQAQYCAFNKAIVTDAQGSFPGNVACNTMHSLAFRAVGKKFAHRLNSNKRMWPNDVARFLGISDFTLHDPQTDRIRAVPARTLAGIVMRATQKFCQTTDAAPTKSHFEYVDGIDFPMATGLRTWENNERLRDQLLPALQNAMHDVFSEQGQLPYSPNHYLKLWAMNKPHIAKDVIFFDEGQDADPVQLQIVMFNADHAQLVIVGDSQQAIYGWRGAVDALGQLRQEHAAQVAFLTQSFRFGPPIADVANTILNRLDAELRLTGTPSITSVVGPIEEPKCILTRTNAMAIAQVLAALEQERKPHLVGGASQITSFAKAAQKLQNGQLTDHPEFGCFANWNEVQAYVANDPGGAELRLFVKLVDDYTPEGIIAALDATVPEANADVVISTAHKAKGREWTSVTLAADFASKHPDAEPSDEELRLLYVAATRARHALDLTATDLGGDDEEYFS